jgi:hypothetical protein
MRSAVTCTEKTWSRAPPAEVDALLAALRQLAAHEPREAVGRIGQRPGAVEVDAALVQVVEIDEHGAVDAGGHGDVVEIAGHPLVRANPGIAQPNLASAERGGRLGCVVLSGSLRAVESACFRVGHVRDVDTVGDTLAGGYPADETIELRSGAGRGLEPTAIVHLVGGPGRSAGMGGQARPCDAPLVFEAPVVALARQRVLDDAGEVDLEVHVAARICKTADGDAQAAVRRIGGVRVPIFVDPVADVAEIAVAGRETFRGTARGRNGGRRGGRVIAPTGGRIGLGDVRRALELCGYVAPDAERVRPARPRYLEAVSTAGDPPELLRDRRATGRVARNEGRQGVPETVQPPQTSPPGRRQRRGKGVVAVGDEAEGVGVAGAQREVERHGVIGIGQQAPVRADAGQKVEVDRRPGIVIGLGMPVVVADHVARVVIELQTILGLPVGRLGSQADVPILVGETCRVGRDDEFVRRPLEAVEPGPGGVVGGHPGEAVDPARTIEFDAQGGTAGERQCGQGQPVVAPEPQDEPILVTGAQRAGHGARLAAES